MRLDPLKLFAALCLAATLAGCSGRDLLNHFVPDKGYQVHRDLAYGRDPRQRMDIYVPDGLAQPACTVLFIYGGRWQEGDRDLYRFAGEAFSSKGCVTAVADYRLYPAVRYPAFVEDAARALVFLHAHSGKYGGDPSRIFVAGHSAGAYNAVMLAVNPRFIRAAGGKPSWIRGAIGIAGPYDFLPFEDQDIVDIFSTEKDPATQPINYVTPGLPPIFLATGDADTEVKPRNAVRLAAKLREAGNKVTLRVYPGAGHAAILLSLLHGFRGHTPLLDDIAAFIRENR
jgi:acetyl esterase/lipase